ncbi:MAG: hypothetical protein EON58_00720 [Alphaproteobacteria bacterium]|nr:MAG: hypothetical protein EON58_00720 [Alphaproteobacteria bacterium]
MQSDERGLFKDAMSLASGANNAALGANTKAADADARSAAAKAEADAAKATALQGAVAWISDKEISYSSTVTLSLAPRTASFVVEGAKVGDRIYIHRRGRPTLAGVNVVAGISLESTGFVPADGTVEVYHTIPAVGVGQTLSIPIKMVGYRPAAV